MSAAKPALHRGAAQTPAAAVDRAPVDPAGQAMTRVEAQAMRGARAIGELPAETSPVDDTR